MLQVVSILNLAILQPIDHETSMLHEIVILKCGTVPAGSSGDDASHSLWYWTIFTAAQKEFH